MLTSLQPDSKMFHEIWASRILAEEKSLSAAPRPPSSNNHQSNGTSRGSRPKSIILNGCGTAANPNKNVGLLRLQCF